MSRFGPDARRELLREWNIVPRDDDHFYRSHPNVPLPGHYAPPTEAELLSRSWREGDPNRTIVQTTIDTRASGPDTGMVRRTQVINLDCPWCGQEALLPAPGGGRDAPFVCGGCADDAYHARAAEEAEADLRLRDAAGFLGEVLGGYDHPLGNPMLRPRHRVAER